MSGGERDIADRKKTNKPLHHRYKRTRRERAAATAATRGCCPSLPLSIRGPDRRISSPAPLPASRTPHRSDPPHALAPQRVSSRGSRRVAAMADCKVGPPAPIRPRSPPIPREFLLSLRDFSPPPPWLIPCRGLEGRTDGLCQLRA
jgi:hypothetical protein